METDQRQERLPLISQTILTIELKSHKYSENSLL
jgi:hypothetical protein